MKKLNLAQRVSSKILALLLITLVFITMLPLTALADNTVVESPYAVKNLTATYDSTKDAVDFSWTAPESTPYELWICADEKLQKIDDVTSNTASYLCQNGGEYKYYILSLTDENDSVGVKSEEVTVKVPYTLVSIDAIDEVMVENNLTAKEISKKLPKEVAVMYEAGDEILTSNAKEIKWDTKNVEYNKDSADEQAFTMIGEIVLGDDVVNRNNVSLECSAKVNVKAAQPISIVANLDNTEVIEKKQGQELILTVEASGTIASYQWYMRAEGETEGTPIKKENKETYRVGALSLDHSASYYCVITGKDGSELITNEAVVEVAEKTFFEKLHKTFIEQNGLNDILSGLGNTLIITAGALIIGVIIGVIIAVAKYFSEDVPALKPISWLCDIYVTVIRGIPVTVLLIITFFIIMSSTQNGLVPAIITFGINSGAYMAEIIRSGINAVDKGQMEAGRSLGMTKMQAMTRIILPQAVRYILPAIGNEFIALLKETSVAGYVAVEDLTRMGNIVSAHTYDVMMPRLLVALIYLVLVVMLSQILNFVERRLAKNDKRK